MNKLYVKIKMAKQQYDVAAIKEKNHRARVKAAVLNDLINDIDHKTKNGTVVNDPHIFKMVKQYLSKIEKSLSVSVDNDLQTQKDALSLYVPKMLTHVQLSAAIRGIIRNMDKPNIEDLAEVLRILKKKHEGEYVASQANSIAKKILRMKT